MHRVASHLGKTVREIECIMSVNELEDWSLYLSHEPTNSIEIQLALLTTVVSNMMGGKHKINDFLITQYKPQKDTESFLSQEQIKNVFSSIAK